MSFNKRNDNYDWELTNFCVKCGYKIQNSEIIMLEYFEQTHHPKSIISFIDRRWNQEKMLDSLGFVFNYEVEPICYYWKNKIFISEVELQKQQLSNFLNIFNNTKTIYENMKNNGYMSIYDCGKTALTKIYT